MYDLSRYDVSRETVEKLATYVALIEKWTLKINLISRNSLSDIWARHIEDSVQITRCAPKVENWTDIGSGGGLPALVSAILASDEAPNQHTCMIESDQRKATFLRTVIRTLCLEASVISSRIEQVEPQNADILSARALTDLSGLLSFADLHLHPEGAAIFPKGITWKKELEAAQSQWSFQYDVIESNTQPGAVILKIKEISRA